MSKIHDLTEGSIIKKLFSIAFPVLLTSISQMAYNLTDLFWVGRVDEIGLVEKEAISAVGTAGYIAWFAFGLIMIAKIGTGVKVAHSAGEKDMDRLSKFASNGLLLQVFVGLFISAVIILFRRPIVGIFNIESSQVVSYAIEYLSITGGLIVFQFISSGFAAINEGLGKTKTNFKIMSVGLAINIALDPLLILVFRMGVTGAAIATVIAQAITAGVFYLHYRKYSTDVFRFHLDAFDLKTMKNIIKVGLPAGIQSMVFTTISIYIARMVFGFGEDVMAAQRIGTQIEQFTWMIAGGFQTALTVFVGQNFGAKQFVRIRKGFGAISMMLVPYSAIIALALFFIPAFLIGIFIDDPISKQYGIRYLEIISLAQIFMMLESIGAGMFNGIGKTYIPSIVGIAGNALRIPFAHRLVLTMAEEGIWWALNISDIIKGAVLFMGAFFVLFLLDRLRTRKPGGPRRDLLQPEAA
ncbi:MAG: MATE family efflux transporter [Bacilli bacterium]|nr:MATE family efflux transporter [Bacilli bacterium]